MQENPSDRSKRHRYCGALGGHGGPAIFPVMHVL